jgi:DNA polymerase-3 subunit alpha
MAEGERREQAERYRERLRHELGIIRQTGYDGYFLIVGEVMHWSREQGIPVGPGRGSGAGSVVAWALGITDVDPLRFGLLFERFLNPERISMPDFDLDFCQQRREEVIAHVRDLYGTDRVAQIITFGSLKARAVVRDVGRTLGLSYSKVDELAKQVPENPANPVSLREALASEKGLQEARATDGDVERLFEIALALEGLNRNVSTHAAGLVIGDRPIEELVPLYRDPRSEIAATQYDMKRVEQAGLVKFDFLGLKTLTSMSLAVRLLGERGTELDLEALPLDDEDTYALLASGETGGIFQLESPMMREVLRRLQPNRIEDLVAILALYRPGPMDNIPSFIERRRGREKITYPHEKLHDILEETSGIWVYQEQVMETAQVLAGFSLGEADILRRAMGKKIKSEMQALEADFVDRSVRNQVPRNVAEAIFADLEKFAGYGFNKSHAVAYALISYRTAYLKAHHPADFFAAMMTIESGNRDKLNLFHDEITSRGISLLPPDINRSRTEFTVEPMDGQQPAVRCGLGTLRGVGNAAMDVVVNERDRAGPFADLWDLARRSRKAELNKEHFENLAEGGALDGLLAGMAPDQARAVAHAAAQMAARCGQEAATEERLSQSSLFGGEATAQELWVLPEAEPWDRSEVLARELTVLGFYGSGHPLEQHAEQLAAANAVPLGAVGGQEAGAPCRVAGVVTQVKERVSQQKRRFARVRLSDATGAEEVMVFPETLARYRDVLREGTLLLVEVTREADSSRADSLIAHDFALLEDGGLERELPPGLKVRTDHTFDVGALFDLLATARPGSGRVELVFPLDGDLEADLNLGVGVRLGRSLRLAVERLSGVIGVEELSDQESLSHTV